MAKDYSNKVQFFIKKGYPKELLEFVVSLDPEKHFNYFIDILNKFSVFDEKLKDDCLLILNMLIKKPRRQYPSSLEAAIQEARDFKKFEESYDSRVLHVFNNGFHIYLLDSSELYLESQIMSNCLDQFIGSVKKNKCAILSLRDKNKNSLVNIQVFPNGSIGQNFEKSNRQVKLSNWKYIVEFFSLYGKDLSKVKGLDKSDHFTTLTLQGNGFVLPSLAYGIPISIKTFINEKGEVETFSDKVEFLKVVEGTHFPPTGKFGDKNEIIKQLDELKERLVQAIDRLKLFSEEIEGKNFFLNDEVKQKIFGDNFRLKNDISEVKDIINSFSQKNDNQNAVDRIREAIIGIRNQALGEIDNAEERQVGEQPIHEEGFFIPANAIIAHNLIDEDVQGHPVEDVNHRLNQMIRRRFNDIDDNEREMYEEDYEEYPEETQEPEI